MRFWRIATARWALDRKCEGARIEGGRWNPVGTPALYAGTTPVICALEKFVHLDGMAHPPLKLVVVEIPDDDDLVYTPRLKTCRPTGPTCPCRCLPRNSAASGSMTPATW